MYPRGEFDLSQDLRLAHLTQPIDARLGEHPIPVPGHHIRTRRPLITNLAPGRGPLHRRTLTRAHHVHPPSTRRKAALRAGCSTSTSCQLPALSPATNDTARRTGSNTNRMQIHSTRRARTQSLEVVDPRPGDPVDQRATQGWVIRSDDVDALTRTVAPGSRCSDWGSSSGSTPRVARSPRYRPRDALQWRV